MLCFCIVSAMFFLVDAVNQILAAGLWLWQARRRMLSAYYGMLSLHKGKKCCVKQGVEQRLCCVHR